MPRLTNGDTDGSEGGWRHGRISQQPSVHQPADGKHHVSRGIHPRHAADGRAPADGGAPADDAHPVGAHDAAAASEEGR